MLTKIFFISLGLFLSVSALISPPPGGWETVKNTLSSNTINTEWEAPPTYDEESYKKAVEALNKEDPYEIKITEMQNYTRIDFLSVIYRNNRGLMPNRYILTNRIPDKCKGRTNLSYAVFLPGFGAEPIAYGEGFPIIRDMIDKDELCCFLAFMPQFFILPFGGYWYTNNAYTVPQDYLFLEVIAVIEAAMGNMITRDPKERLLMGHSMGGFGAVMNSMRTNMRYFSRVCGLNGGLYIWNLPDFQNSIRTKVIAEAVARKAGPFKDCDYTQPPYRYYADEVNFNTMVSTSLASVFHADGSPTPKPNNPWFSAQLFNPDCNTYSQTFGFRYWLDENGVLDESMFNMAPQNSPLGYLEMNHGTLKPLLDGNIYLSTTTQDEIVDVEENILFSDALNKYGINHRLFLYNGTHLDAIPGMEQCLAYFKPGICRAQTGDSLVPEKPTLPVWALGSMCAVGVLLILSSVIVLSLYLKRIATRRMATDEKVPLI